MRPPFVDFEDPRSVRADELRVRALETQVDVLSERLGFTYRLHFSMYSQLTGRVPLHVRLDDRYALFVDVPYVDPACSQRILAALPRVVKAFVAAARSFHGLRWGVESIRRKKWTWKGPKGGLQ